jgi:hypothetical protein
MPDDRETKGGSTRRRALAGLGAAAASLLGGLGALISPKRADAQARRLPTTRPTLRQPSTGAKPGETIRALADRPTILVQHWTAKPGSEAKLEQALRQMFDVVSKENGVLNAGVYKQVVATEGGADYIAVVITQDASVGPKLGQNRAIGGRVSAADALASKTGRLGVSDALIGRISR